MIFRQLIRIFKKFFFLNSRKRTENEVPWLAAPPTKIGIRKNRGIMHGTHWVIFFFKNCIKNQHLFFKGDGLWNSKNRVIAGHAFPAHGLKNGGVTRIVKKTEKNSKIARFSRYFKNLQNKCSATGHLSGKNYRDFRTVIFGVKKFFTENRFFFDFCKKIG